MRKVCVVDARALTRPISGTITVEVYGLHGDSLDRSFEVTIDAGRYGSLAVFADAVRELFLLAIGAVYSISYDDVYRQFALDSARRAAFRHRRRRSRSARWAR